MEIQQLRYFLAAVQSRSFAKAAQNCFTTRQNVSRSIASLEDELGTKLFMRIGNTMLPTPAGEIAVEQAQQVIDIVDNMKRELGQNEQPLRQLNLAISSNLFAGVNDKIISAVDQYSQRGNFSETSCEECYQGVIEGKIDAALVTAMERNFPNCTALKLGTSAAYLLVGANSRLASRNSYAIEDLRNIRFSLMSNPPFQYEPLINLLKSMNYTMDNISVIASTSSMIHYVKREDVASIVTERMAAAPPEGTTTVPIIDSRVSWNLYMLYREDTEAYPVVSELVRRVRRDFVPGSSF